VRPARTRRDCFQLRKGEAPCRQRLLQVCQPRYGPSNKSDPTGTTKPQRRDTVVLLVLLVPLWFRVRFLNNRRGLRNAYGGQESVAADLPPKRRMRSLQKEATTSVSCGRRSFATLRMTWPQRCASSSDRRLPLCLANGRGSPFVKAPAPAVRVLCAPCGESDAARQMGRGPARQRLIRRQCPIRPSSDTFMPRAGRFTYPDFAPLGEVQQPAVESLTI